jgi:hypothetical protein
MNWTPAEEAIIAAIMHNDSTTRAEAIRTMQRRKVNGVYRAPAKLPIGKLFAITN